MSLSTIQLYPEHQKYIVRYSGNWADEMDLEGFSLMDGEELNKYIETAKKFFATGDTYSFYVGTNEEVEYESLEDFLNDFTATAICDADHAVFQEHMAGIGFFPDGPEYFDEDGEESSNDD